MAETAGIVVASGSATSVAANTTSADQVSGTYQFLPSSADVWSVKIVARSSATGMFCSILADGQVAINDKAIPFTGTAGGVSINDNLVASAPVAGGSRIEFYLRNSTGGAITTDYQVLAEPVE